MVLVIYHVSEENTTLTHADNHRYSGLFKTKTIHCILHVRLFCPAIQWVSKPVIFVCMHGVCVRVCMARVYACMVCVYACAAGTMHVVLVSQ